MLKRGIDTRKTRFSTSFGRGLDYYTGFEFELHRKGNGSEPLVAGGRYDGLMTQLGSAAPIPAVGFSIWVDALVKAGKSGSAAWMMLGFEANRVVGLRVTRMMLGGRSARREAKLMVTEKVEAALEANTRMMSGASADEIIRMYRRRVAANARRLSKRSSGGSTLKRKGRKHKWL